MIKEDIQAQERFMKKFLIMAIFGKGLRNDFITFIGKCYICIKQKGGFLIKLILTKIIPKGTKESFDIDSWKLNNELTILSGYSWIINIIGHFSKYMFP